MKDLVLVVGVIVGYVLWAAFWTVVAGGSLR